MKQPTIDQYQIEGVLGAVFVALDGAVISRSTDLSESNIAGIMSRAGWEVTDTQGDKSMPALTAKHLAKLGCEPENHAELLQTGLTVEHLTAIEDAAQRDQKRIKFLALIAFIKKYQDLAFQLFAAVGAGPLALGTFLLAHAAEAPAIWAEFVACFV